MRRPTSLLIVVGMLILVGGFLALLNFPVSHFHGGSLKFGPLLLGGESPLGPGAATFAPELSIPPSRFYIGVADKKLKNFWCVFEECSPIGAHIAALGGWLQGDDTNHWTNAEDFGLTARTNVVSVIVVGDKDGKIVGIYPDKTMADVGSLLAIHRNLWEH